MAAAAGLVCVIALGVGVMDHGPTDESSNSASPALASPSLASAPAATEVAADEPSEPPRVVLGGAYLVSSDDLARRGQLAREGLDPWRRAVDGLISEADDALNDDPRPRNPLGSESDPFVHDTRNAYTLALAWGVTGNERYARHAAQIITAWVEAVDAAIDTCPTGGGSDCATSLLVSRHAPGFVFAAELVDGSGVLSNGDQAALRDWLAELILPAASLRTNNWGDAGVFMRLAVADYIGAEEAFLDAVDDWRALMDLVAADGEIPEETRRGSHGLLYTQGAVSYKVGAAVIAERRGIDLWGYEGQRGGTLRRVIDALARYLIDPQSWPWHDRPVDAPSADPVWEIIHQRWPEPAYAAIVESKRPFGSANSSAIVWTTVTHGEPLAGVNE